MNGNSYLILDTSVLIDHIRTKDKSKSKLNSLILDYSGPLATSMITVVELYSGASVWEKDEARQQVDILLEGLRVLEISRSVSVEAGRLRNKYKMGIADSIVAATTLATSSLLATLDKKDFSNIAGLNLADV